MSRVERLMSAVFVGVWVALFGPFAEHPATTSVAMTTSKSARRIRSRIRALLGGSAHFRGRGAEALVVDVVGDRRMLAADRALWIAAQTDFAEAALERVVQEIAAHKRLADPEHELDRFGRLHRADDAGQDAEHARLRA